MRVLSAQTRPAEPGDAVLLASVIRPADAAEIEASGFPNPLDALVRSMAASAVAFSVELEGELACVGGVQEMAPVGCVWLITGAAVDRNRRAFWRESQRVMGVLLKRYRVLTNRIDARYGASIRWARRLGAEVHPPSVLGAERVPFHQVVWRY